MSDDCDTSHEPPQYGGVRCECGEELLPYCARKRRARNSLHGFRKLAGCRNAEGRNYGTARWLDSQRRFRSSHREGIPHIQEFRAMLAECVDLIDRELAARKFR